MSVSKVLVAAIVALFFGAVFLPAAQAKPIHHHHHLHNHLYNRHLSYLHYRRDRPGARYARLTVYRHAKLRRSLHAANPQPTALQGGAHSNLIALAERYVGGNPTGRRSLWCADFANLVLRQAHLSGTRSRLAKSFLSFPRTNAREGAIAVMGRRGGGHVGFVAGFDQKGNPIIISGNGRGHKVSVAAYDRHRILKYVAPI